MSKYPKITPVKIFNERALKEYHDAVEAWKLDGSEFVYPFRETWIFHVRNNVNKPRKRGWVLSTTSHGHQFFSNKEQAQRSLEAWNRIS